MNNHTPWLLAAALCLPLVPSLHAQTLYRLGGGDSKCGNHLSVVCKGEGLGQIGHSCPKVISPICPEHAQLEPGGVDDNGCDLPPICVVKTPLKDPLRYECQVVTDITCPQGSHVMSGGYDEKGCMLPHHCEPDGTWDSKVGGPVDYPPPPGDGKQGVNPPVIPPSCSARNLPACGCEDYSAYFNEPAGTSFRCPNSVEGGNCSMIPGYGIICHSSTSTEGGCPYIDPIDAVCTSDKFFTKKVIKVGYDSAGCLIGYACVLADAADSCPITFIEDCPSHRYVWTSDPRWACPSGGHINCRAY